MYLARIDGTLTSTIKHETLGCVCSSVRGWKAMAATAVSRKFLVDMIGANVGSIVLVTTDNESVRKASKNTNPVRLAVMGIVDSVYMGAA